MKILLLSILIFFSYVSITHAIPIPALALGYEFILLVIPSILAFFSIILFYFRKYLFIIDIYLLLLGVFFYFFHYYITNEVFLYRYEYIFFVIVGIVLILVKSNNFGNNVILIILLFSTFFLMKTNIGLIQNRKYINEFIDIYGVEKIQGYIIKDNFFVVYFNHGGKELVVSNCLEGIGKKPLLLREIIKDFDKTPSKNGYCIYGNLGEYEYNTMVEIIES